jgi:hypothetical protein
MTPEESHSAIYDRLVAVEAKLDKVAKDTVAAVVWWWADGL